MARFLAIDWDHNQLHVVLATAGGGTVRVQRAAVWRDFGPLNAAGAAAAGVRLKDLLKEAKIPAAPVLASLGRDRIIVKDIRYPVVPPHEEPAVVRFQAVKELTHPAEEVVIDYAPLGEPSGGEQRAIVLIARRELVAAYQELCRSAGLKLAAVTPRPFGIAACLERVAGTTVLTPLPDPPGSPVAVVAVTEGWAEFCVVRGGTLLMARSLTPGQALATEVRRNLAVYAGQAPGQAVKAVYVAGGPENAALRERLRGLTDIPVHLLDPFAGSEQPDLPPPDLRGGFAGLVGLLQLRADRRGLPVNLAQPKEPRPASDPNRRRVLLGAALVAALLVALGTFAWLELSRLDREVKRVAARNAELDRTLAVLEEDDKRVKALAAWNDNTVVWLEELYDLTDCFPDPDRDRVRLSQLEASALERRPGSKEKYVARLSLKGVTGDDLRPVQAFVQQLVADGHYRIGPVQPSRNTGPDARAGFTQQFEIKQIDIEKRPPEKYVRQIPEERNDTNRERPRFGGRGGRGGRE